MSQSPPILDFKLSVIKGGEGRDYEFRKCTWKEIEKEALEWRELGYLTMVVVNYGHGWEVPLKGDTRLTRER